MKLRPDGISRAKGQRVLCGPQARMILNATQEPQAVSALSGSTDSGRGMAYLWPLVTAGLMAEVRYEGRIHPRFVITEDGRQFQQLLARLEALL